MASGMLDTAERMALLPSDVPRDAVIVTRDLHRDYVMGSETVRAMLLSPPGMPWSTRLLVMRS